MRRLPIPWHGRPARVRFAFHANAVFGVQSQGGKHSLIYFAAVRNREDENALARIIDPVDNPPLPHTIT